MAWAAFMARWPTPAALAADTLDEALRAWDGLATRGLHRTAALIAQTGWPRGEGGLRALPGVGVCTARALLALAFETAAPLPQDVNIARVVARAACGEEPAALPPSVVDGALARPTRSGLSPRHRVLALFDLGATVCRGRAPRCSDCALHGCRSRMRSRDAAPRPLPRRPAAYTGSHRQLRGAVLRAALGGGRLCWSGCAPSWGTPCRPPSSTPHGRGCDATA